ncbi:hypothetical protein CASFOL_009172 [Castilleja foliolosa]|uniref:Uncharacterized protein n=1 Tax=Castilleja foliolosa TaxID=1961234 RepID=A0ABD3CUK6_9LAMI
MSRRGIPRWVVQESETEGEESEEIGEESEEANEVGDSDSDLGEDVTERLEAPFTVYEKEAPLYESIIKRETKAPVIIDYEHWQAKAATGDRFAIHFTRLIRRLRLVKFAGIKRSAYPTLMHEFYTTVNVTKDGTIKCRFGGEKCEFDKYAIMDAFGFFARGGYKEGGRPGCGGKFNERDEEYNEKEFWDEIKCKGIGDTKGFPLTALQDNATYLMYRFLATSVFGKEDSSRIPKEEIYLLWKILKLRSRDIEAYPETHGFRPINLYPYILSTIKNTTYIKASKSSNLGLGAMVTVLAWSKGWRPGDIEKVRPRMLPTGKRLLRTPLRPEGKPVEITILRNRDDDEDADFVRKDPPMPRPKRAAKTKSAPPIGASTDQPRVPIGLDIDPSQDPIGAGTDPTPTPIGPHTDSPAAPIGPETDPPFHPIGPSADPYGTEATPVNTFPYPPEFEVPPTIRARARKDRTRPGEQVPPSPPRVARVSFDGPTRKEFEDFKQETRANHRALMEGQATLIRYAEEDRAWKKRQRELVELLVYSWMEDGDEEGHDAIVDDDLPPSEP